MPKVTTVFWSGTFTALSGHVYDNKSAPACIVWSVNTKIAS